MLNTELSSNTDWNWWTLLIVFLGGFGVFGILLGFIPYYSPEALYIGIFLTILITAMGLWSWNSSNLTPNILLLLVFTIQLLGIGIRFWIIAYNGIFPWLPILGSGFILAWVFPILLPELSVILWREQTAPQTKVGKILLSAIFSLAPIAGVLGASGGMYSSRLGNDKLTDIAIAILFTFVAIGLSFTFAYQIVLHHKQRQKNN